MAAAGQCGQDISGSTPQKLEQYIPGQRDFDGAGGQADPAIGSGCDGGAVSLYRRPAAQGRVLVLPAAAGASAPAISGAQLPLNLYVPGGDPQMRLPGHCL